MISTPISNWGTALITSLTAALTVFLAALPGIIGFSLILIAGWIIGEVLVAALKGLLRAIRFDNVAQRAGLAGLIRAMNIRRDASGVLVEIVRWFLQLIVLVAALDTLGIPAVSTVLQQLLLWLPNGVVAFVVLVIAGLVANALSGVVYGAMAESGLGNPGELATIARASVWGFGIIVALNQIGVAASLVNTLFMGLVGAVALAFGLAFGLGARETAGEIVRNWYRGSQSVEPRAEQVISKVEA